MCDLSIIDMNKVESNTTVTHRGKEACPLADILLVDVAVPLDIVQVGSNDDQ